MSTIPIEISARHVHLTAKSYATLFGADAELKTERKLSQADEFASSDMVTLQVGERKIEKVRVLGPCRDHDQVEVARTDSRQLKVDVPLRLSGNVAGSAPVTLIGPVGQLDLPEGMIVARRHLHIAPAEAQQLGVTDGQEVAVKVDTPRGGRLDHCIVRVKDGYHQTIHLDTDEGNALGLTGKESGNLIIP